MGHPYQCRTVRASVLRLALVLVTLLGLLSTLALQSLAGFNETPRAEIERLTGVDIAADMEMSSMGMSDMAMDGGGGAGTGRRGPNGHDVRNVSSDRREAPPVHHHDATCALCPLLVIGLFILIEQGLRVFARSILTFRTVILPPVRAPPGLRWILPPSHAPPLIR